MKRGNPKGKRKRTESQNRTLAMDYIYIKKNNGWVMGASFFLRFQGYLILAE